jgi:hypothetical protein
MRAPTPASPTSPRYTCTPNEKALAGEDPDGERRRPGEQQRHRERPRSHDRVDDSPFGVVAAIPNRDVLPASMTIGRLTRDVNLIVRPSAVLNSTTGYDASMFDDVSVSWTSTTVPSVRSPWRRMPRTRPSSRMPPSVRTAPTTTRSSTYCPRLPTGRESGEAVRHTSRSRGVARNTRNVIAASGCQKSSLGLQSYAPLDEDYDRWRGGRCLASVSARASRRPSGHDLSGARQCHTARG